MDKYEGKLPLEGELVNISTSSDSDDSEVEDNKFLSILCCSRDEHKWEQSHKGTRMSNKVTQRNRPATVSGNDVLSILPVARLSRPPCQISTKSFLRTVNPPSTLTEDDLAVIRGRYGFPNEVPLRLLFPNKRVDTVFEGWI